MRIWNFTPHPITFISGAEFNSAIRKFTGGEIVSSIPSDGVLNANLKSVQTGMLQDTDIPLFQQEIVGCDELPAAIQEGDVVIVSALYATAYKASGGKFPLYGVKDPVMTEDGNTFRGCRGLQIFI